MPLPESSFKFRRIFTYVLTLALLALLTVIVVSLDDVGALERIGIWLIGLIGVLSTYYMIAPTAEQLADIIKAGNPMKGKDDD